MSFKTTHRLINAWHAAGLAILDHSGIPEDLWDEEMVDISDYYWRVFNETSVKVGADSDSLRAKAGSRVQGAQYDDDNFIWRGPELTIIRAQNYGERYDPCLLILLSDREVK